ncbi:hypothetical protein HMPREF3036_00807 [Sutterella sp. KLE1602]|nr:hypothetical protein HMPREF3036_00807 [Sutterella sp. KLE1602]
MMSQGTGLSERFQIIARPAVIFISGPDRIRKCCRKPLVIH